MKATAWTRVLHRQAYAPGWLGVLLNPFYIARVSLHHAMHVFGPKLQGRVLDVGSGAGPYRELIGSKTYVGMDIDSATTRSRGMADVFYDGRTFPFAGDSFDGVLCTQVLEHVFHPDEFLEEIRRVMVHGGRLLLTVPFVWDEHEQPWDFARYTSFGLKSLLERHGFRIVEDRKLVANASALFQLGNAYLYKVARSLPRWVRLPLLGLLCPVNTLLGLLAARLLPDNPDFYLDNVVLAERVG